MRGLTPIFLTTKWVAMLFNPLGSNLCKPTLAYILLGIKETWPCWSHRTTQYLDCLLLHTREADEYQKNFRYFLYLRYRPAPIFKPPTLTKKTASKVMNYIVICSMYFCYNSKELTFFFHSNLNELHL